MSEDNMSRPGVAILLSPTSTKQRNAISSSTAITSQDVGSDPFLIRDNSHRYEEPRLHSIRELAPGTIIRGLHLSEVLTSERIDTSDWRVRSDSFKVSWDTTRSIQYKHRFLIVVEVFESHFTVVPVVTKSGKGLQGVPEYDRQNYMLLRDHRYENFIRQSLQLPLLETREMEAQSVLLHPKSVVMYNGPSTMFALHHPLEVHGQLTSHSTAVLLQHFHKQGAKVLESPTEETIKELDEKARIAKIHQQKFKDALALNPHHGKEARSGNRQPTPSPPKRSLGQAERAIRKSASEGIITTHTQESPPFSAPAQSAPSVPSHLELPNAIEELKIIKGDEEDSHNVGIEDNEQ